MVFRFSDGTEATCAIRAEQYFVLMAYAKAGIANIKLNLLYCGKIMHVNILDLSTRDERVDLTDVPLGGFDGT